MSKLVKYKDNMFTLVWHHIIYTLIELVVGAVAGWLLKGRYGSKASKALADLR